jgi:hypothetical protein
LGKAKSGDQLAEARRYGVAGHVPRQGKQEPGARPPLVSAAPLQASGRSG